MGSAQMDDLSFRKAVYAEPFTKDAAVIEAAKQDPKKQAFWDEIKQMENELKEAMHIPVPENLAEKLILRQSLDNHTQVKKQRPWYIALAASVMFASVLSVYMFSKGSGNFQDDVFAHMSHVNTEVMKGQQVDLAAMNNKLATFNGSISDEIGEVVSANYCYLNTIKSLHLIIKGENGLTSLFVVPDSITDSVGETFSNASYKGASFLLESAKVIIVGDSESAVNEMKSKAQQALSFSA